jgi:hypothetical protein
MELNVTIYDNSVLTQAKRYNQEQFEDICQAISRYFSLYSYEEVRFVNEDDTLKLTYYKNDKQCPIPAEWFRREYEFGYYKNPKVKKLIGTRIPLSVWTDMDVILDEY